MEEEQKLRAKIELQLDTHNKKVKEISGVMDTVEREMEKRDANIVDLEGQVHVEKSKIESLEAELQKATKIIDSQKNELLAARQSQKNLVQHCEHVEAESRELQEFLQVRRLLFFSYIFKKKKIQKNGTRFFFFFFFFQSEILNFLILSIFFPFLFLFFCFGAKIVTC